MTCSGPIPPKNLYIRLHLVFINSSLRHRRSASESQAVYFFSKLESRAEFVEVLNDAAPQKLSVLVRGLAG